MRNKSILLIILALILISSCYPPINEMPGKITSQYDHLSTKNIVSDIVRHTAFKDFGELLLPRDNNSDYYDTKLSDIGSLMPYHSHVSPDIVVGALNHMIDEVNAGKTIFYSIYTDEQKKQDPGKMNTGLFFLRGDPGAPFAVVCPGGGFLLCWFFA